MKQVLALAVVVGVVVSMAVAAEVRSVNTVGYHAHSVDPGDLILVSPTVDNMDGNQLNDILGEQLPVGSSTFVWDGLGYNLSVRVVFGGPWSPNVQLLRGQAAFIQLSGTAGESSTFAFTGEVPEDHNGGGTTSVDIVNLDATGYPYPIDIEFGSTQAAIAAGVGTSAFFWDQGTQSYDAPAVKQAFGGWGAAETRVISIGEAYFMETTADINVDEIVPYDLS